MPKLDGSGPDGRGSATGRRLGRCTVKKGETLQELGSGMGFRRKSGGGKGIGKRLSYSDAGKRNARGNLKK